MALSLSFAMGTAKPQGASAETVGTEAMATEGGEPAPATTESAPSEATVVPSANEESASAPTPLPGQPAPVTEAPASEEPELVTETPAPVSEEPAPVIEEPPVSEEPAPITEEAPPADESAPVTEEAPVDEVPATTKEADEPDATVSVDADEEPTTRLAVEQAARGVAGDTVDQCNNVGTVGGDTITCAVTITNDCTYRPATPNRPRCETTVVTTISCTGSAMCPTGTTQILTDPVTVITQCNNAGTGGASTITCTVTVTNNLFGFPRGSRIDSTVVQCQNPGAVDTLTCVATPPGNNRIGDGGPGGQTVRQCNRSGGQAGTMTCTVTAPPSQSTGLPVNITQCIESGTTGASTVTCTATITNNFIDSIPGEDGPGGDGPGGGGDGPGGGGDGPGGGGGDGPGGDGPGVDGPGGPGTGGPGTPGGPTAPGGTTPPTGTFPPTGGGDAPPSGDVPPGGGGNSPPESSTSNRSAGALPFTGFDIGIAAMFSLLTIVLGLGLRRLAVQGRPGESAGGDNDRTSAAVRDGSPIANRRPSVTTPTTESFVVAPRVGMVSSPVSATSATGIATLFGVLALLLSFGLRRATQHQCKTAHIRTSAVGGPRRGWT